VSDIEVIVPCVRPKALGKLLRSFAQQSVRPTRVTVVTNHEVPSDAHPGDLTVRQLSFTSKEYAIGQSDVALRRNVGLWWAESPTVLFFDDDQLAPGNLIASLPGALEMFGPGGMVWGNYRYVDWTNWTDAEVRDSPPSAGRAREKPNVWHRAQSCYGGLFASEAESLRAAGGFDLVYTVGSGEDQALSMRIAKTVNQAVWIHEPPFAWHTTERLPYEPDPHANVCSGEHDLEERHTDERNIFRWVVCKRCPFVNRAQHQSPQPVGPIVAFDRTRVDVTSTAL
jgi:hypothetical protein